MDCRRRVERGGSGPGREAEALSLESVDGTETCEEGGAMLGLLSLRARLTGSNTLSGGDVEINGYFLLLVVIVFCFLFYFLKNINSCNTSIKSI